MGTAWCLDRPPHIDTLCQWLRPSVITGTRVSPPPYGANMSPVSPQKARSTGEKKHKHEHYAHTVFTQVFVTAQ